jgi:hypothetical protein
MLRFLLFLLGLALVLIGVLAGGCSVVFTFFMFDGSFDSILPIWLAGLVAGGLGLFFGIRIFRSLSTPPSARASAPLPDDLRDAPPDTPPSPPSGK